MKMSIRDAICRLCLKVPNNQFILIDETTRQGLDALFMKMNFDVSEDPLMCDDCAEILKRLLSFVLVCLEAEKTILLLDTDKDKMNTDLKDVYVHESKGILYADTYICRLCIKKVEERNFVPLDNLTKENAFLTMLKKYMLGMDRNIIENTLICFNCRDAMDSYIEFVRNCRDTEKKINTYLQNIGTNSTNKVILCNVLPQFFESTQGYLDPYTQVCDVKKEYLSMEDIAEIMEGKDFVAEGDDYHYGYTNDRMSCTCDTKDGSCLGCSTKSNKVPLATEHIKIETVYSEMNGAFQSESETLDIKDEVILSENTHPQSDHNFAICTCNKNRKNCNKCNPGFEIVSTGPIIYECITDKTEAGLTTYKCTSCDFKTIYRRNLRSHALVHKTEAEVTIYKCTTCAFKTKHKNCIITHSLIHKTESEVKMYTCTLCDFKTKRKHSLKSHSLTHKTELEVTMFKCAVCDYKSKHKGGLKRHLMTHTAKVEGTLYKCTVCDFKTNLKNNFKSHSLAHRIEAGVEVYKCTACDFIAIHKKGLERHSLVHKSEAEVTMYKCEVCDHKTKNKYSLKKHSLTHKPTAEGKMYKCTVCNFKTKGKNNLKSHLLSHKIERKEATYKCTVCDFKTVHRSSLRNHSLIHKAEGEVTMYKCAVCNCDYKTRHKGSLKRHSLTHKTKAEVKNEAQD